MAPRYQRILLKLSGEGLAGESGHGISDEILHRLAEEVREVHAMGVQVGIVLGGGSRERNGAQSSA